MVVELIQVAPCMVFFCAYDCDAVMFDPALYINEIYLSTGSRGAKVAISLLVRKSHHGYLLSLYEAVSRIQCKLSTNLPEKRFQS